MVDINELDWMVVIVNKRAIIFIDCIDNANRCINCGIPMIVREQTLNQAWDICEQLNKVFEEVKND